MHIGLPWHAFAMFTVARAHSVTFAFIRMVKMVRIEVQKKLLGNGYRRRVSSWRFGYQLRGSYLELDWAVDRSSMPSSLSTIHNTDVLTHTYTVTERQINPFLLKELQIKSDETPEGPRRCVYWRFGKIRKILSKIAGGRASGGRGGHSSSDTRQIFDGKEVGSRDSKSERSSQNVLERVYCGLASTAPPHASRCFPANFKEEEGMEG